MGRFFVSSNRATGKVKFFSSSRGFGFLKPDDGSKDVFISVNNLPDTHKADGLKPDERVSYVLDQGKKGLFARDVSVL